MDFGAAEYHVIPAPLEETVSYGGGTATGPAAILEASHQLESFDSYQQPDNPKIHTREHLQLVHLKGTTAVDCIAAAVTQTLDAAAVPIILGGEHTVTAGALKAFAERKARFGVVQFDAHADLRQEYEGSIWSHACVMRRALDLGIPVFQIGVRSLCQEEHFVRGTNNVSHLDAEVLHESKPKTPVLPPDFPKNIYITFDVDAFDASLMPATGTPEPGGLFWWETLQLLEQVTEDRTIIGFDVVELAPAPPLHHCNYTAAKLTYKLIRLCELRNQSS